VFAENGFANSTVREVGERAELLSGSLYHHFPSKDAMLEEILRAPLETLIANYRAADTGTAPDELLRRFVGIGLNFVAQYRDVVTIIQNDMTYISQFERFDFVEAQVSLVGDIWRRALRAATREGYLRADLDIDIAFRVTMGSILTTVRWYRPEGSETIDDIALAQFDVLLNGLRA
jgi:AcrR family transcriptional regulator